MDTLLMILGLVVGVGLIVFVVMRRINDKKRNELYMSRLETKGFKTAKRLIVMDFLPASLRTLANLSSGAGDSIEPWVGIWVDYNSKKLAVRTSQSETDPQIFSFGELQDYELFEGQRSVLRGTVVGFGPLAKVNIQQSDYADSLSVRIVLSSKTAGVDSITIPLFKVNVLAGGKSTVKVDSTSYTACYNCALSIIDELGNIMRTTGR